MWKTTILFGLCLAVLLVALKWVEYSFFIKDLTLETYLGIVGGVCVLLGGWMGWKLTQGHKAEIEEIKSNLTESPQTVPYPAGNRFTLSPREHEVLVMIAQGLSYQEVADQLHVSLSTVKTHVANIFSKMDVQRRTQAVMLAQNSGLLPPLKVGFYQNHPKG